MILGRRKTVAALAATAIVASGAMWTPAAQAAPTCTDVPGETIGAWVKVGPVDERIPAISGIRVCAGGATTPLYRVETSAAGGCTTGCLTVYVGGSSIGVEGAALAWREDGVEKSAVVGPQDVSGTGEVCVLSTGIPVAPDTSCFAALGVDDPTGVVEAVEDAVEEAGRITCGLVPDYYDPDRGDWVDFCTDPEGWTRAAGKDGRAIACNAFPILYDDWGNPTRFCDQPVTYVNLLIDDAYESCNWAVGPQWDPNTWNYVYFCDDPIRWTELALDNWCGSLCDPQTLQQLIAEIRRIANENIKIQIG